MHREPVRELHPGRSQHRRPEDRVEAEDVLPDEVLQARRGAGREVGGLVGSRIEALPGRCLHGEVVLPRGEVADGRVEPDVDELSREVGVVHREPEVRRVAGDAPVLEVVEPALDLLPDGGVEVPLPLDPGADGRLDLLEVHVGVIARADHRCGTAERAVRVLQLPWVVGGPAPLADVPVLVDRPALRAGPLHEPVGKEARVLLAEELLHRLLVDEPAGLERVPDAPGPLPVLLGVGGVVGGEVDPESPEVLVLLLPVALHEFPGGDARPGGVHLDGRPVGVGGADVGHRVPQRAPVTDVDVGLDVLDEVAKVDRPVGVRQGTRHEDLLAQALLLSRSGARSIPTSQRSTRIAPSDPVFMEWSASASEASPSRSSSRPKRSAAWYFIHSP